MAIEPSIPSQSFTIKLLPVSEAEPVVQIVRAEVLEQFGGFCWWKPDAVPGGAARAAETRLAAVKNHCSEGRLLFYRGLRQTHAVSYFFTSQENIQLDLIRIYLFYKEESDLNSWQRKCALLIIKSPSEDSATRSFSVFMLDI